MPRVIARPSSHPRRGHRSRWPPGWLRHRGVTGRGPHREPWWFAVLLLAVLALWIGAAAPAAAASPTAALGASASADPHVPGWAPDLGYRVTYAPPAPGRVLRAFDPPGTAFGAGHRGVDLELAPGAPVRAAGSGRVTFAGPVAGMRWVSIAHVDGHLTTYGPLADLSVRVGDRVERGDRVAALAAGGHGYGGRDTGLHWGARDATGAYVDPLSLLGADLRRPSLIGGGRWTGTAHAVTPYDPWQGARLGGAFAAASPTAERPGFAVPPNPNHLILVGGLGSSSGSQVLEPAHLGYPAASVTALSYAGRSDLPGLSDDPRRDQLPYGPEHTWEGPERAAALLAEQLRAQAAREPGRAVDLIGHSMGGVAILWYLAVHHDPYDPSLPPIGHVVTIGSPLRGSDLAVAGEVLGDDVLFGGLAEGVQRPWSGGSPRLPLDAPAIGQLATGSRETARLTEAWEAALQAGAAGPLATGTRVLTIAGSRDLVVTPHRAQQPGSDIARQGSSGRYEHDGEVVVDHRVLPGGHGSVLETEAVHEVTWRFLAGEEVVDSPGRVGTVLGGELGDTVVVTSRLLQLWGLWRGPSRWSPPGPSTGPPELGRW